MSSTIGANSAPQVVACLKWVAHPGEPDDERFAGMSAADRSALEFALQQAAALDTTVTAITVGPHGADHVLREALACGASRAVRVHADSPPASAQVAHAIATTLPHAAWIWCGDYSLDRGTGSVPAYLAAHLDARQALGVLHIDPDAAGHTRIRATRRLDGGRRELLLVEAPAVISVEGATATLRRASLAAVRAAATSPIEVVLWSPSGTPEAAHATHEPVVQPYRPRARVIAAPHGAELDRLRALTDSSGSSTGTRGEHVELAPPEAAQRIVDALRAWGYLPTHD